MHGLSEVAEELASELDGEELPPVPEESKAQLLQPPTPILRESNWPLLLVQKGFFEGAIEGEEAPEQEEERGAWGEEADVPEVPDGDNGDVGEEVRVCKYCRAIVEEIRLLSTLLHPAWMSICRLLGSVLLTEVPVKCY